HDSDIRLAPMKYLHSAAQRARIVQPVIIAVGHGSNLGLAAEGGDAKRSLLGHAAHALIEPIPLFNEIRPGRSFPIYNHTAIPGGITLWRIMPFQIRCKV